MQTVCLPARCAPRNWTRCWPLVIHQAGSCRKLWHVIMKSMYSPHLGCHSLGTCGGLHAAGSCCSQIPRSCRPPWLGGTPHRTAAWGCTRSSAGGACRHVGCRRELGPGSHTAPCPHPCQVVDRQAPQMASTQHPGQRFRRCACQEHMVSHVCL